MSMATCRAALRAQAARQSAARNAAAPVSAGAAPWHVERHALTASKEIILCEALIDAMTFWCAGYRNVTAAYGAEGFTADMLEAFRKYGTERILIAYDRDEAGDRGAAKVAELLKGAGIECWRSHVPARDGRQRIRAEGDTGQQKPWPADPQGGMDGRGESPGPHRHRAGNYRCGRPAANGDSAASWSAGGFDQEDAAEGKNR